MTVDAARNWIIVTSLTGTSLIFVFFLIAPTVGYPLAWDQAQRIIEILLPVFLGYLGSATHFLFHNHANPATTMNRPPALLGLLVKGPIFVFSLACTAIVVAFGMSNRSGAEVGAGMSTDQLAWALTAALGILAATTGVAVSFLFSVGNARRR